MTTSGGTASHPATELDRPLSSKSNDRFQQAIFIVGEDLYDSFMPLDLGQNYAGYTILRELGAGGMGIVYLAQHPRLPRQDALKVLPSALTVDEEYRQRFNREADIAASLWHPHIVEVHDRGELDGQLWISMDYVEGTDAGTPAAGALPQRHAAGRGSADHQRSR